MVHELLELTAESLVSFLLFYSFLHLIQQTVALTAGVKGRIKVSFNVDILSFTGSGRQQSVLLEESVFLH